MRRFVKSSMISRDSLAVRPAEAADPFTGRPSYPAIAAAAGKIGGARRAASIDLKEPPEKLDRLFRPGHAPAL